MNYTISARGIQAGRVWVNCCNLFPSGALFWGLEASGYGREDVFEAPLEFTEVKNVVIDSSSSCRCFYD